MGRCPRCGGDVRYVAREEVSVGLMQFNTPKVIAYLCPHQECRAVLSVHPDLDTMESRILAAIAAPLTRLRVALHEGCYMTLTEHRGQLATLGLGRWAL
jgi:hypothetical protein